jgi:hypothetical protein
MARTRKASNTAHLVDLPESAAARATAPVGAGVVGEREKSLAGADVERLEPVTKYGFEGLQHRCD